jgi:nitrogen fixation protein FixH
MVDKRVKESAWRNPWVWLLIGILGTTLIVNGTLITIAFLSPPGLVVEDYYDKGKDYFYNQAQLKKERARLGWVLSLDLPPEPKINISEAYLVRVVDASGRPVSGAQAEFAAFRPTEHGRDFTQPMRDVGGGFYATDVSFKQPGNWDLIVTVQQGDDKLDIAKRIFVKG